MYIHLHAHVGARAWLFVGFLFAFGGLIGSLWILVQEFLVPGEIQKSVIAVLQNLVGVYLCLVCHVHVQYKSTVPF